MSLSEMRLSDLPKHAAGRVIGFDAQSTALETRLRDIGFAEGDNVRPLHFGLFGRNPMSVRLNGAIIAMRRADAEAVLVEKIEG